MEADNFESMVAGLDIRNYSDWLIFKDRLESAVEAGRAREVSATRIVRRRGERWYLDVQSGEIYVCVEPDDRISPSWGKVEIFRVNDAAQDDPKNIASLGLRGFPLGKMDRARGESYKFLAQQITEQGQAEMVSESQQMGTNGIEKEIIFRDCSTGYLYRLNEEVKSDVFCWERILDVPENHLPN